MLTSWRFPQLGYPKASKSIDYFSIESRDDLGIPHFRKPPYVEMWCLGNHPAIGPGDANSSKFGGVQCSH